MFTLAIAASKGGVSKTTLASCLAIHYVENSHAVAIADLDSQLSLARWHARRVASTNDDCRPFLVGNPGDSVAARVKEAKGIQTDYLVLDCPPGSIEMTERAIAVADFVIVPIRPSPFDVLAINPIVELSRRHRVPYAFVLSAVQSTPAAAREMAEGARSFLQPLGTVLAPAIFNRPAYALAAADGRVGPKIDKTARSEIDALAKAITKAATKQGRAA